MSVQRVARVFIPAVFAAAACLLLAACPDQRGPAPDPSGYRVELEFLGPVCTPHTVYAAWIEDEYGNNLQNIYICNRVKPAQEDLEGTPLPYWTRDKYSSSVAVDAVSTPSVQSDNTTIAMIKDMDFTPVWQFRICFDIDRSTNSNDYFYDRPAFTYKTEIIDFADLKSSYDLSLTGWMANSTAGTTYGQQPKITGAVTDFAQFEFNTHLEFIEPLGDMVASLTARVVQK